MADLNQLKALMDFYEKEGIGQKYAGTAGSWDYRDVDRKGMAADWAQKMMMDQGGGQQPAPNFFAQQQRGPQPAYVQPQASPQGPPPGMQGMGPQGMQSQRPQIQNYLAQLMQQGQPRGYSSSIGGGR